MGKEKRGREDEIATSARAEKKKMQAVQRGTGYTIFDKIPFAQRSGLELRWATSSEVRSSDIQAALRPSQMQGSRPSWLYFLPVVSSWLVELLQE